MPEFAKQNGNLQNFHVGSQQTGAIVVKFCDSKQVALGNVLFSEEHPGTFVARIGALNKKAIDYVAVDQGLHFTFTRAIRWGYNVHISESDIDDKIKSLIESCATKAENSKFALRWQEFNDPIILKIVIWNISKKKIKRETKSP